MSGLSNLISDKNLSRENKINIIKFAKHSKTIENFNSISKLDLTNIIKEFYNCYLFETNEFKLILKDIIIKLIKKYETKIFEINCVKEYSFILNIFIHLEVISKNIIISCLNLFFNKVNNKSDETFKLLLKNITMLYNKKELLSLIVIDEKNNIQLNNELGSKFIDEVVISLDSFLNDNEECIENLFCEISKEYNIIFIIKNLIELKIFRKNIDNDFYNYLKNKINTNSYYLVGIYSELFYSLMDNYPEYFDKYLEFTQIYYNNMLQNKDISFLNNDFYLLWEIYFNYNIFKNLNDFLIIAKIMKMKANFFRTFSMSLFIKRIIKINLDNEEYINIKKNIIYYHFNNTKISLSSNINEFNNYNLNSFFSFIYISSPDQIEKLKNYNFENIVDFKIKDNYFYEFAVISYLKNIISEDLISQLDFKEYIDNLSDDKVKYKLSNLLDSSIIDYTKNYNNGYFNYDFKINNITDTHINQDSSLYIIYKDSMINYVDVLKIMLAYKNKENIIILTRNEVLNCENIMEKLTSKIEFYKNWISKDFENLEFDKIEIMLNNINSFSFEFQKD